MIDHSPIQRITARWVLPICGEILENGLVEVQGDRITQVRPARAGEDALDLGEVVLMPGLVNTHTHLEFSSLKEPIEAPSFADWIRQLVAFRQQELSTSEQRLSAIRQGIAESISSGVTTIGEIATDSSCQQAYADLPTSSVVMREVIGLAAEDEDDRIELVNQFLAAVPADASWQPGISPHAPYTLRSSLFERLCRLANDKQLCCAMHLAESQEELELVHSRSGPLRVMLEEFGVWRDDAFDPEASITAYLEQLSTSERALVIHGNYLDPDEWQLLAENRERVSLVYCPRTHRHFDHPCYRLAERLAAGVRVVLGTDSRASNPDLDLLAEVKEAARLHPQVAPQVFLQMATLEGAAALGLSGEVGELSAGARGNLVVIAGEFSTSQEVPAAILSDTSQVVGVMVAGRWLRQLA